MKSLREYLSRHSDIALVLLVLGVLVVLFAPIPSALLDFLILTNFCFAFLILLLTFYYGKRVGNDIEFSDFLQLASLGLVESIDRFDPSHGVQFRTYASRRMHGALVDGIEKMTERQQQGAARARLEQQRRASIEARDDANGTRRTPEQLLQYVAEAGLAFALSWLLDGTGLVQVTEEAHTQPFYRSAELQQLRQRILDLVRDLPPQERRVVHGHYFQEQLFEDIAESMHLTKGRISQIHRRALLRLRESLDERKRGDVSW